MDPHSSQSNSPTELPSNYLDTIAAQPTQSIMKPWLLWTIIGGVVLLVIIIVIALLSGGTSSNQRLQQMLWRAQSVNTLAGDSDTSIKSSKLRAANSNLATILAGAEQEGLALLPKDQQKAKQPKDSKLAAYFTKLATTLEDARLNGDFDTPYAREAIYQIGLLRSEITYLSSGAKSSLRAYLNELDKSLELVEKEFLEFDRSGATSY